MSAARRRPRRGLVIGPSDGGTDVSVVLAPPRQLETPAPAERAGGATPPRGFAHINRWRLNDRDTARSDETAHLVASELARQPGFIFYALVRTGPRDVAAVTVFETQAQLLRAMEAVAPLVRRHVLPLAAARPQREAGAIVHYRAAS